ncbi:stearoyl-CoA desaturase isoform X2 [Struthio camelus]|uniref:stearoyl-CoA desaturase isoform X2 n=1 Tax=Struthio camelus TaxID=8801 RepID=UPI003603E0EF
MELSSAPATTTVGTLTSRVTRNGDVVMEKDSLNHEDLAGDRGMIDDIFDETYREKEGPKPPLQYVWRNIILMSLLHLGGIFGLVLIPYAKIQTLAWAVLCFLLNALGITAGSHRLWSHRSYKATLPLRIFLTIANSLAFQNDIYEWVRDHRVHHKFSETDADPHNAMRGFFFSHIGWLLVRKHPDVIEKGQKLDLSDVKADKVVMFQRRYYKPSVVLLCFTLPTVVPWYFWEESLIISFFIPAILRYVIGLNATWLVNSAAHMFGNRPYDRYISPRENPLVSLGALDQSIPPKSLAQEDIRVNTSSVPTLWMAPMKPGVPIFPCTSPIQPSSLCILGMFPRLAGEYIRAVGLSTHTSLFPGWKGLCYT